MAEKTELDSWRTYMELSVAAEIVELPDIEARWAEDSRHRVHYRHLWRNAMGALENLEERYREGQMTPGQEAGYEELKGLLMESVPTLERLGFALPPIPLDDT